MRYDIVIIGGGLVGTGLAAALRNTGLQIALIDARLPSNNDHRLFALSASSCQFLQNVDVWQTLAAKASPIHQVHVSRQGRFGSVRLKREEVRAATLGHVIPARDVETALNDLVAALPETTCKIYRPAKLLSLTQHASYVELVIEAQGEKNTVEASLVIGADGAESTVRSELGIALEEVDYQQTALVFKTTLQRSHQQIAYERFTDNGAIAMLPLPDNQCASILTLDNAKAAEWLALDDESFIQTLQREFGYRLGRLQAVSQRYTYPLRMRRAKQAVDGRVMLIGNAAHTLHPIAAQGFNLAVHEVAALADILTAANGDMHAVNLAQVHQQSSKQQSMSMGVSSKLPQLFSKENAWLSVAAQLGMVGLDIFSPLKQIFIKGMMGQSGAMPSLLMNVKES
jgi:2-octaprenyl-6-methoxyphenol hydroxylase